MDKDENRIFPQNRAEFGISGSISRPEITELPAEFRRIPVFVGSQVSLSLV
jgi:hypothetical protein